MTQTTESPKASASDNLLHAVALSHDEQVAADRSNRIIWLMIAVGAAVMFVGGALRHHAFRSGAMDLGFFDQLVFLISRGQTPMSSIGGFHALSDHAAYTLYLIAPLYWIWPSPHTLLIVQAIALSIGAYPVYRIAQIRGLSSAQALALAGAYLLYPIVLAASLTDFHPETVSVAALLFAVLCAMRNRTIGFVIAILLALGGKEIISLTVVAMGVWLALAEKRRLHGAIAIVLGIGWFLFATQVLIPHFGAGRQASGMKFFSYIGTSVPQIIRNFFLQPQRWIKVALSVATIKYLFVLFAPVAWGLVPRHRRNFRYLLPLLLCAAPTLAMNILARDRVVDTRRPFGQYSLMVVPFLAVTFVYAVAAGQAWLMRPRAIAIWSIGLVLLGVGARAATMKKAQATDAASQLATREAVALVRGDGGVLTTHEIAPHLSDRKLVQFVWDELPIAPMDQFDYVLLNTKHESFVNAGTFATNLVDQVRADPDFQLQFDRDSVLLYKHVRSD